MSEILPEDDPAKAAYDAARSAMAAGELERALALFTRSIAHQWHAKAFECRGECLIRLGHLNEAIGDFAAATALNRNVRPAALLAAALAENGDLHDAVDAVAEALRRGPRNRLANQSWSSLAERLIRQGSDHCDL